MRHQSSSETLTLPMLCSSYSPLRLSAMVLQQSPTVILHENPEQDAEKSRYLDLRSLQNFAIRGHQSYCWSYTNKIPPLKNC